MTSLHNGIGIIKDSRKGLYITTIIAPRCKSLEAKVSLEEAALTKKAQLELVEKWKIWHEFCA